MKWGLQISSDPSAVQSHGGCAGNGLGIICGLMLGVVAFSGAATAQDSAGDSSALLQSMVDAGMITQEEYEQALAREGRLGEATAPAIANAMTSTATPKREYKELTYDARQKEMQARLPGLAEQLGADYQAKRQVAEKLAEQYGLQIRQEFTNGVARELVSFENDMPKYFTTHNQNAARTISADRVWPSSTNGFALAGNQTTLAIWDAGAVDGRHVEFLENGATRIQQKDAASAVHYHATSVAGTMAATGFYATAHGMVPVARLYAYDWSNNLAEIAVAAISNEIRISNHSYGYVQGWSSNSTLNVWEWWGSVSISTNEDSEFGRYSSAATNIDNVAYGAPYHLCVFSAGNDRGEGPTSQPVNHRVWIPGSGWVYTNMVHEKDGGLTGFDSVSHYACAKNILSVGAIYDITNGYQATQDVVMTSFSCFGPTDDGRIKPDIVANGVALFSPIWVEPPNHYWDYLSGTSQAAPTISGALGLLLELQNTIRGTNHPLLASTLKGIVIHTADDAGNVGPDFSFGWGLANILHAAQLMTEDADWNSRPHIKETRLVNGDYIQFQVLGGTNTPLKISIAWTDPTGPAHPVVLDPTNLVLVNDLDLRVIGPTGTTNYPWILDPTNPSAAALTGDNYRDNVEQVAIFQPSNDWYTVKITHKGTLAGGVQDVSIIIGGNQPTNAPELAIAEYFRTTNATHWIEWPGVVGSLYRVEAIGDMLDTNDWGAVADDIYATKDDFIWEDSNPESVTNFYRVREIQ